MDDLFALLRLYIISVSSGRWEGDNGKQCEMKPRLQLKIFRLSLRRESSPGRLDHQASADPPLTYRAYRETKRQSDSQPARQTDNHRERERDEYNFAHTAATSLLNFSNQHFVA